MTSVGIDIAKDIHWASAIDAAGKVLLDRKVLNTPQELMRLADELRTLPAPLKVGVDVLGGIATLTQAVVLEAGFELVHVSGLAVNRAREGTVGGESKSDPRDARVIADQVRTRRDLRAVTASSELDIELRLLVSRRRDLSEEQTRRLNRMHDLLAAIFPELERSSIPLAAVPSARRSACRAKPSPPASSRTLRAKPFAPKNSSAHWMPRSRRALPATLMRPSSAACPAWGPCLPLNSSPR